MAATPYLDKNITNEKEKRIYNNKIIKQIGRLNNQYMNNLRNDYMGGTVSQDGNLAQLSKASKKKTIKKNLIRSGNLFLNDNS